eukprot:2358372-Rhodomonas_salina.1
MRSVSGSLALRSSLPLRQRAECKAAIQVSDLQTRKRRGHAVADRRARALNGADSEAISGSASGLVGRA